MEIYNNVFHNLLEGMGAGVSEGNGKKVTCRLLYYIGSIQHWAGRTARAFVNKI